MFQGEIVCYNEKDKGSVRMAKRKKRKDDKKKTTGYHVELIGILLILIAILGAGSKGGFGPVGRLIGAFAAFLVGAWYNLLLVAVFVVGVYMMVKRERPNYFTSKLVGLYVFCIGILVFSHLSYITKNDLQKAINTEFESYCADKGYNPNVFETRYAIVNDAEDKDKLRVIHVADNKIELNKRIQKFENYKLTNITPISISITDLLDTKPKENCLVVNMEENTIITTIIDEKVYEIATLEQGSKDILNKINLKENSYSKAYEICKNTTIYTSEGKELQDTEINYLEDIMPTLYDVVGQVKKKVNDSLKKIDKVYITGTATLVNNIDLYFQEYLPETNCEILKPYFITPTKDITIKDYIEVNSALSLALAGLGEGIQGMNFKTLSFSEKIPDWLKVDVNPEKTKKEKKYLGGFFTNDLGQKLDKTEKSLIRTAVGLGILLVVYSGFSILLNNQMQQKYQEAEESISSTNQQIELAEKDNLKIQSKTNEYTTILNNLQEINDRVKDVNASKNTIPNLLNEIMFSIPEGVQITSIQNTADRKVEITAQSDRYDQLGMFKAIIQTEQILTNVVSSAGQKENNVITVKIEGELP